ncbi:tRNA adenosine(34) deaminase TadA [Simiduia agarivorans]|uniref:tRNA-specific adenosine deaminase n=1 Tax=Simiduia agarivorans (strain DSM 21679 / JCM 13881 / BCRC 17597 / SA1) TaxID=1117647 RepID=K4KVZ8_SIMAS|nr:tRNA adenosine(34) deaminase TadA [Simiduia agarivorans]AFU98107.1 CMP/dCMP deaminase zinc-binding protein [Simiduia agarivorans SA1 = DSM 21679]
MMPDLPALEDEAGWDAHWMRQALAQAELAAAIGEVPVGAVLVRDNQLIASAYNHPIEAFDPTAHAEIAVLREAALREGNYRLPDTTLYVTLEPCAMCAGALVHARVARLVYGATEPKAGVVESQSQFLQSPFLNHRVLVQGGVLADQAAAQLSSFFAERRRKKKALK